MPAGGFRTFVAGEVLDEGDINDFLMQGVLVFGGTAERGSAIGTPIEGQFSFLTDTDTLEFYDGSSWVEYETLGEAVVSSTTGSPNIINYSSGGIDYRAYEFTGDGSITFSRPGSCDALLVAGGGVSRFQNTRLNETGGGAGGMLELDRILVSDGTFTVTVGAGGARWGEESVFSGFYAVGGGRGQNSDDERRAAGNKGGSGSGSATELGDSDGVRGIGIDGQGNAGAATAQGGDPAGGGAGGPASGSSAGPGKASSITGSSVTYATGGSRSTTNTANSGNGGGGGLADGNSGVVVIRVRV